MDFCNQTFTLTYGECAENHRGMQQLGQIANEGFTKEDIDFAIDKFNGTGNANCHVYELHTHLTKQKNSAEPEEAYVLVVKDGLRKMGVDPDKLFVEQNKLEKDKKAVMYGRVVNKIARHNLCFDDEGQEPDYDIGKGTVVPFSDVPLTRKLRNKLPKFFGKKAKKMKCEGNYYYDVKTCGVGFHGDEERKRVIGVRLGESIDLHHVWYLNGKRVGDWHTLTLDHGDVYLMSEKAVGNDFKKRKIYTLRHAAGSKTSKYVK